MLLNLSDVTPFRAIHPGEIIRDKISALGMSQREIAKAIGLAPSSLNEIIKGCRALSAETAALIGDVVGVDGESLMRLQTRHDKYPL